MTKEEQIEALKEAKRWEAEQTARTKNAKDKIMFAPLFITFVITIVFLMIGVKGNALSSIALFLNFIVFNVLAFYYRGKHLVECKELGVTKGTSTSDFVSVLLFGNLIGAILNGIFILVNS